MATLFITGYDRVGTVDYGPPILAGMEPAIYETTLDIGSGQELTDIIPDNVRLLMVETDTICHIDINENPEASTSKHRVPADALRFYCLPSGHKLKLAVTEGS